MPTREPGTDDGRVLWRATDREDDQRRSGSGDPADEPPTRGRSGPASVAECGGRSPPVASSDADGRPAIRRRAVLKGLGSGAVVTGLAGCQTDGGRTEVRRTATDGPGTATDEPGGRTETPGDGTETPEDGTETPDGEGPQTETQCFETKLDCPDPCTGQCELVIEFTYDFERADDGTISISRFRVEFVETTSDGGNCSPEFGTGTGTFEFEVAGEQPCSVDREAVFECECGMTVQFEDLDPDDDQDCVCPDFQQIPVGACGEPVWFEKTGDFESIAVDFEQDVSCGCQSQVNTGSMDVQIRFADGEIAFGGDTADC